MNSPSRLLLAGVAALAGACARTPVALDLAAEAALATLDSPWDTAAFGGVAAEALQGAGLVWAAGPGESDGHVWAAGRAELLLRWTRPEPRLMLLDMAPYPGLSRQAVEVTLNGDPVGRLALDPERRRYLLTLPATAQRAGRNVLRLEFATGSAPQKPRRLRLGAALYGLTIGPAEDPGLARLAETGAPPPLGVETASRGPRLVQVGPSRLRFALRVPRKGELRVTPGLHPAARGRGGRVPLRVTLEEEGRPERELWRGSVGPNRGPRRELSVALGGTPGALARLTLHVEGPKGAPFAWVAWSRPRVLGHGDPGLAVGAPARQLDEALEPPEAASLRRSLEGAHVLLILLDAAGARHLSCYGYPRSTTPEIDRIAAEGVRFENAYSPAGFTLMAMSSIWTGQLPDQHHNGIPYNSKLPRGAVTLAEALGAAGVHTAAFVHNAFAGQAYGLDQGFAEFHETYRTAPRAGAELYPELLAAWLRERPAGERVFAYLHFREPHFPYDPPPPFDTLFGPDTPLPRAAKTELDWLTDVNWGRRRASTAEVAHLVRLYDGNLRYADEQVGRLRRLLEESGLWDRTVLILTADHGDALHEHGFIGHLTQAYEEVTHVPLILRFPKGSAPRGLSVQGLADLTDVAPTVMDLMGLAASETATPDFKGRSLLPMLWGAPGKEAVVSRTAEAQPKYALRHERFKYLYHGARSEGMLFDLAEDPAEARDLAARRPVRADFYRQVLHRFILEQRRGPRLAAEEVRLTEEQRENLRALGYVE